MQGRWTLMGCPLGRIVVTDGPSTLGIGEEVPVVPCNDAAIERAMRAIPMAGDRRDIAEAVLRAAGETP